MSPEGVPHETAPHNSERVVVSTGPVNAETAPAAFAAARTPAAAAYVRTNFGVPDAAPVVAVGGLVRTPLALDAAALATFPRRAVAATMECAGNDRLALRPLPAGEPWGGGAVATAEWGGVPLAAVLARAGVLEGAVEVVATGADAGPRSDAGPEDLDARGVVPFARSLPLREALRDDVLLAVARDGRPLLPEHGAPVRLVVPGWYGMASVKWLARLDVVGAPFEGYFQRKRYVYDGDGSAARPVTRMRVKAMVVAPADGARVPRGRARVWGWAWSGAGPVARVEVALGGGDAWVEARLEAPGPPGGSPHASPHAWTRWEAEVTFGAPGRQVVRCRATDAAGATQPDLPPWTRLGYGNNAVRQVVVTVDG